MAEQTTYVVDASTAGKRFLKLPDEPHWEIADAVLQDLDGRRVRLIAPHHIRSELGHLLTRAVRRGRITFEQGRESLEDFYRMRVELVPHSGALLGGYQLAQRYGCSFYDATYLALAAMTESPFVHADGKLRDRLAGQFPFELWIQDYPR